jgi:enoyl-CoA hydratase
MSSEHALLTPDTLVRDGRVQISKSGGVALVRLNRPEKRNAFDGEQIAAFESAMQWFLAEPDVVAGVLTGAGGAFCAGMDLKAFARSGLPARVDDIFRHGCQKPLIAAIEGVAVGGGLELALIADLLVASSEARFGSPEVTFGLFPGGGALLRLPRHLPQSVVTEMALTGEPLSAQLALQHGLIVRMCEPGQTLGTALELAARIARNAPLGIEAVKRLARLAPGGSEDELWPAQRELVDAVFHSDDAQEGARAFAEKRPPQWTGR